MLYPCNEVNKNTLVFFITINTVYLYTLILPVYSILKCRLSIEEIEEKNTPLSGTVPKSNKNNHRYSGKMYTLKICKLKLI